MPKGIYPRNQKGWKHSEETKKKMSVSHLKNPRSWKDKNKHKEHCKKVGFQKGKGYWSGKKRPPFSEKWRRNISKSHKGEKCNFWEGGKSKVYQNKHRNNVDYKIWRGKVFERDNWDCQTCGKRSEVGNPIYLHPHHIKGWTKYPKLRYEVDNGITLCQECHKLLHKKKK